MTRKKSLNQNYIPSENEPYMSDRQVAYFKEKLTAQKTELSRKMDQAVKKIKTLKSVQADILDRSNAIMDMEFQVKSFERHSSLIKQIERALRRIEDGSFGYCELTGGKIGLRRLEAMPFATMSIKALEEFEASQAGMGPSMGYGSDRAMGF